MTMTLAHTIPLPVDRVERSRSVHPARPARWSHRDGKVEQLCAIPSLGRPPRPDLVALARVADVVHVGPGTVLEEGWRLGQQWWMPIDGWLLAEGDGSLARTIPAGHSWVAPRLHATEGRLTALRAGSVLVARVPSLASLLTERPRLGAAIRSTLVSGDV